MRNVALLSIAIVCVFASGCYRDEPGDLKANASKAEDKGNPQREIPENGIAMSKNDLAAKADIPLYPGSITPEGLSKIVPSSTGTKYEINMTTSDPVSKVADFYQAKLHLDKQGASNAIDMFGMTPKGLLAKIKIGTKNGKTEIQAVSIDEKKV